MNRKIVILIQLLCLTSSFALWGDQQHNYSYCDSQEKLDRDFEDFTKYLEVVDDKGMLNNPMVLENPTSTENFFRKIGIALAMKLLKIKHYIAGKISRRKNATEA